MATIKAIKPSSVHQIQSGQVIVDLNSVVKELVENSLDAGASSIEVRFKNNGLDSIEVSDNGKGIAPEDYESIALKHHTSKLGSYDDLDSLSTFGFRGEALSSLCALSEFRVVTAVAGAAAKGSKLEFDISGALKGVSVVAAQQGTTVTVEKLFKNLPVRRKELEKNLKREYAKVLNLLQAYACISTDVRFSVSNQVPKGKKTIAFTTNSNPSTRENIANVYGAKTLSALVALDLRLEMKPSGGPALKSLRKISTADSKEVRIEGHISKPIFGEGRQASDRQMFFVNSRPCGLPQVAKAFNEVYKGFNMSQSPFVFANLVMDTNAYDVNVSPDKRTILLHDQAELLDSLKAALTKLFDAQDQTIPTSQLQSKKLPVFKQPTFLRTESTQGSSDTGSKPREASPLFESPLSDEKESRSQMSLIHAWAGRDAVSRDTFDTGQRRSPNTDEHKPSLPFEWSKPIEDAEQDMTNYPQTRSANDSAYRESSPRKGQQDVTRNSPAQAVISPKNKDARSFLSPAKKHTLPKRVTTETVQLDDDELEARTESEDSNDDQQEPITAVRTPTKKITSGPVQNAFDRMRPKRLHDEIATVMVGDQTTIMTLGSDYKRRRIHTPNTGVQKSGLTSSLRAFAAPGTQMSEETAESPDEDDEVLSEDEADEGQSDASSTSGVEDNSQTMSLEESIRSRTHSPTLQSTVSTEASEDEYLDEDDKKAKEEARVAKLISEAEALATAPTEETLKRASQIFRSSKRRDATLDLTQTLSLDLDHLRAYDGLSRAVGSISQAADSISSPDESQDTAKAEAKLSLTISKSDFARMRIVGQFNLGFILATRPSTSSSPEDDSSGHGQDHLFIIDQHAADERFNFERLSATTTLTPQRLVTPKELQLSAVEEELIANNRPSLEANGFQIEILPPSSSSSSSSPDSRSTHRLLTLPTSKETTFSPADLEELLHLLSESPAGSSGSIVRPSRVRRMLAMRACRSSIMVGRTLALHRMEDVVRNMGRMDRPWNCPHGRPTMRHLAGLREWEAWDEDRGRVDWAGYA